MVNIFLDVNVLVNYIRGNSPDLLREISKNKLVVSSLTWHILYYLLRSKVPNINLNSIYDVVNSVELSNKIVEMAMAGPTNDFEDNVQLYSAIEEDCDYFLTLDTKLLKMKYFGKVKICDKIG